MLNPTDFFISHYYLYFTVLINSSTPFSYPYSINIFLSKPLNWLLVFFWIYSFNLSNLVNTSLVNAYSFTEKFNSYTAFEIVGLMLSLLFLVFGLEYASSFNNGGFNGEFCDLNSKVM